MKRVLFLVFLIGCDNRALDIPEESIPHSAEAMKLEPCCVADGDVMVCRDATCSELSHGEECTTLATDHTCQVPLTDDCQSVVLENLKFRTVYCF